MIIDQLCVFSDNVAVKTSAASNSVAVAPFSGKGGESANVTVIVTEAYAAAASLAVEVQESADNATFTTLASYTAKGVSKAGDSLTFPLPSSTRKRFVRLNYKVTGTTATGKLFAAVTNDNLDTWEPGQYVKRGKVIA